MCKRKSKKKVKYIYKKLEGVLRGLEGMFFFLFFEILVVIIENDSERMKYV